MLFQVIEVLSCETRNLANMSLSTLYNSPSL